MQFKTQTHTLKNGSSISIRVLEPSGGQDLVDLKRSYIKNTTSIPLYLEEYPNDPEKESRLIKDYNESHNSILLVAEHNNELIGNIDLTGSKRSKMAHTAMIGMGIKEEWRNQGLGGILMNAVIAWATEKSELKLIWLDVYASNELGYNLYKKTGFKVSGRVPGFFKDKQGYKDKIQMYLELT